MENRFEVDELREVGDQIVGSGRMRARGRTSGVEVDVPLGVVARVENEKLVYGRFYSDPADAVKAAQA
jgi:ketosteroid isomerase-like protein